MTLTGVISVHEEYQIKIAECLKQDLKGVPREIRQQAREATEKRLKSHPELYGRRLGGGLHGFWRIHVGDYRLIYRIQGKVVTVFALLHRKLVYDRIRQRLCI